MNISQAISQIKMSLGLNGITLPFQDDDGRPIPTENVIHDVLKTVTIPTFSQFVPWKREAEIRIKDLKVIDKKRCIYELPEYLTWTPIQYVVTIDMPYQNTRGTWGDMAPAYGISRSAQGMLTAQAYMMTAGQMRAEPTFDYLGHNQIRLFGWPNSSINIMVGARHLENGESIEEGCYDSFMELAELDVKKFLYNNLKLFDGIQSAFGTINLKIEEYQSADQDRNQLLERWRDSFHLDMPWWEFM